MKNLFFLMLICSLALSLSASEYPFDLELNEDGYYNGAEDVGFNITVSSGRIDQAVEYMKVWTGTTVLFEGPAPAGQLKGFKSGRGKILNIEVKGGASKSVLKCVVEWSFAKDGEVFDMGIKTNKKGNGRYQTALKSGQLLGYNFMASHGCSVTMKMDGKEVFIGDVSCGTEYIVNSSFKQSLQIFVKNAPKNENVNISMGVTGGAILGQFMEPVSVLETAPGRIEFNEVSNAEGCVITQPYAVDTTGVAPHIKVLITNRKFNSLSIIINGITFTPELTGQGNGHFLYSISASLKSDHLNLALDGEGVEPNSATKFVFYYDANPIE